MRRKLLPVLLLAASSTSMAALDIEQHSFSLEGYLRIGAGMGKENGRQVEFQAPGARSKYRLGNETDTKLELGVTHSYRLTEAANAPKVSTSIMLKGQADHEADLQIDGLAQAFVEFEGFFDNGVSVWMGRRYYDRQMVHFTERAWLNTGEGAHLGFGLEGWQIGPGKLAVAAFRHHDPDGLSVDGKRSGTVYSTTFDVRYTGLTLAGEHDLNLWGGLAQRHENEELDYLNKMGLGAGLWIDSPNLFGGQHRLSVLFMGGPLNTRSDFDATPVREEQGFALAAAGTFEVISDYMREFGDQFALQTMLLFRNEVRGVNSGINGDQIFWLSGGGRVLYFLSDYLSLAGEVGVDNVTNELDDTAGTLLKTTLAVQLSPARGYFKPPVMRGFVTIATWDKDFQGAVGGSLYAEDTAGWTMGVQLEHRW